MENQNKIQIPVKTRIAASIMIIVGLIIAAYSLFFLFLRSYYIQSHPVLECPVDALCDNIDYSQVFEWVNPFAAKFIPIGILLLFGGIILFYRKKYSWWGGALSVVLFEVFYVSMLMMDQYRHLITTYFILPPILTSISLLFLFIDRKNYFAAVEKAKIAKGGKRD